jgi:hypothetical protein
MPSLMPTNRLLNGYDFAGVMEDGLKPSRLRPGSTFGFGLAGFFVSRFPVFLFPMRSVYFGMLSAARQIVAGSKIVPRNTGAISPRRSGSQYLAGTSYHLLDAQGLSRIDGGCPPSGNVHRHHADQRDRAGGRQQNGQLKPLNTGENARQNAAHLHRQD